MTNARAAAKQRVVESENKILSRSLEDQDRERFGEAGERVQNETFYGYIVTLAADDGLSENQARFLAEYARDGLTSSACFRAGIRPATYYGWCKDPTFNAALVEARKIANESLERMAIDMASGVYKKPVVSGGVLVCEEEIRDTRMLALMLRARMPERYGNRVDVTSGGQSLVKLVDKDAWDSV